MRIPSLFPWVILRQMKYLIVDVHVSVSAPPCESFTCQQFGFWCELFQGKYLTPCVIERCLSIKLVVWNVLNDALAVDFVLHKIKCDLIKIRTLCKFIIIAIC